MSYLVHCFNKKTGLTYVYRCENYKDSVTGNWKSRRECIGRMDENGDVVATGGRGRKPKPIETSLDPSQRETPVVKEMEKTLRAEIKDELEREYRDQIFALQNRIAELEKRLVRKNAAFNNIGRQLTNVNEMLKDAVTY